MPRGKAKGRARRGRSGRAQASKNTSFTAVAVTTITCVPGNVLTSKPVNLNDVVGADLMGRNYLLDSVTAEWNNSSATITTGASGQVRLTGAPFQTVAPNIPYASQQFRGLNGTNMTRTRVGTLPAQKLPIDSDTANTVPKINLALIAVMASTFQVRLVVKGRLLLDTDVAIIP